MLQVLSTQSEASYIVLAPDHTLASDAFLYPTRASTNEPISL